MKNQRGTTAPGMTDGPAPGTVIVLPPDLTHVEPTNADAATQQGSTQPGDGSKVLKPAVADPPSWREKVVGYAKKHRGTMLRQPEVKEHGDKILKGRATIDDPNQAPEKSGRLQ